MPKKEQQPISKKYIFFLIFVFSIGLYYLLRDDNINEITHSQTYEEMLEYHDDIYNVRKQRLEREKQEELAKKAEAESDVKQTLRTEVVQRVDRTSNQLSVPQQTVAFTEKNYNRLLDTLKQSPYQSAYYINIMIDELLAFKGYPQGTIKVKTTNINQSRTKIQGSYLVANFDIASGNLNIEESILNQLPVTTVVAVLSHELDHFDKLASICRYMGVEQFEHLLNMNGIRNVDTAFWRIASTFGKTENFNGEYYKEALERFISQNQVSQIGAYSDFYSLAENIRNPLEISAYQQSDYVYEHYGITVQEGPTQKLVKEFNDIDWLIHNKIQANSLLKGERIAIFDYLYANTLIEQMPDLKTVYNSCISTKDGDLLSFWAAYKIKLQNSYQNNGQINASEFTSLMNVLNSTKIKAKGNIEQADYAKALANKINTIKVLPLSEKDVEDLKRTTENYIRLITENNIQNPKQELVCKLILLCIENKLYKNNSNEKISLFYLNFPESISSTSPIKKQKQQLLSLYNNQSFRAEKPSNVSEQEYLIELINKHRLNVN